MDTRFKIALAALVFLFVAPRLTHAAFLKFDKTTAVVTVGQTVTAQVIVDAGSDQITSTDAYVTYDSSALTAQSVADGDFFPTVYNNINSSRVYVAGMVDDPADSKTGSGIVATITFTVLKAGSSTLAYKCDTSSESSKVIKNDANATNVIVCGQNGTLALNAAGTAGTGGVSTPAAEITATPSAETLPEAGVADNLIMFAASGAFLLLLGGALQLIIRKINL